MSGHVSRAAAPPVEPVVGLGQAPWAIDRPSAGRAAVLAMGVDGPLLDQLCAWMGDSRSVRVDCTDDAREAATRLREQRYDLLLVAPPTAVSAQIWPFVRRLRAASVGVRWALVGSQIQPAEEITARSLGATAVLELAEEDPKSVAAVRALLADVVREDDRPASADKPFRDKGL